MVRVEAGDLEKWKEEAAAGGMTLSEWIRGRCNGNKAEKRFVIKAQPERLCIHGVEKGFHCWKCGGVAVMKKEG